MTRRRRSLSYAAECVCGIILNGSRLTPDSQKSTTEQGTEKLSSLGDKAAGAVQPGDSKSTTQELSDKSRSGFDSTQDTAKSYANQASDTASDLTNKASDSMPSGGQAQDTGKTYLDQATEAASNAAKYVSDTVQGVFPRLSFVTRPY